MTNELARVALGVIAMVAFMGAERAAAQETTRDIEWSAFSGNTAGWRYSPARQITAANVRGLQVAWVYRTGDYRIGQRGGRFEATPIVLGGTMYLSTPFGRVIALDPVTGAERWQYDPGLAFEASYGDWANRGVTAWVDSRAQARQMCRTRIFVAPVDARLIAIDAQSGRVCSDFGRDGVVDLKQGLLNAPNYVGEYQVTSPPAVYRDLVIIGSAISDNVRVDAPSGVVRAFDARSGKEVWRWDPIPRTAAQRKPEWWSPEAAARVGAANAWAPMAVDETRGLLFVPVGSPSPDYYGGERVGRNDYANSIVALRAQDGTVVWHYQVVHHDVWDYDVPAQPVLADAPIDGRTVPAVIQATKMGHIFVLHRETGAPLFPVEERPVPQSTVPGEATWATQPFPVKPNPIVPQSLQPSEAFGLNDAMRERCRQDIASLEWRGMFTPPSLQGTLVYPGNVGGSNWSGLSYDPERRRIFAPANRLAAAVRLIPRDELAKSSDDRPTSEFAPQRGTPYGMHRRFLLSPEGVPCNPPPWGTLTGIDLTSGEAVWERPLGSVKSLANVPGSEAWGSPNLGGTLTTGGGLVFAAGGLDERLHAFSSETGEKLWSADLPAGGNAAPMAYVIGGTQYIVIAAGGHDRFGTTPGDYVVAYALPSATPTQPQTNVNANGRFEGQLLVGNGRYPVSVQLNVARDSTITGALGGPLAGPLAGRIASRVVRFQSTFTLTAESCTGTLQGELEVANHGTMLVGPVRISGACSDGKEEVGVMALRVLRTR